MSWLSDIFGSRQINQAFRQGAVIIDLRTAYEYDQGHIPDSINIPVDRIKANIERIKTFRKPIILCCSTGDHCWEAANILRNAGVQSVINGGNWQSLLRKVS
jgi:phage shock protein E